MKKFFIIIVFISFILSHPAFALDQQAAVDDLFVKSGMEYQLGNFAQGVIAGFDKAQRSAANPLSPEDEVKVHQLILLDWSAQSLSPIVKDSIMKSLSSTAFDKSLSWLNSPIGGRVTKMEEESSNPNSINAMKEYLKQLNNNPPAQDRVDLIKRWVDASNEVDFYYKLYVAQADSMVSSLAKSTSLTDQANAKKIEFNLEVGKAQIEANAQQQSLASAFYTYKDLSNDELSQYLAFLTSPEGKEYTQVTQQALLDAMKNAQQKISDLVIKLNNANKKDSTANPTSPSGQ
jgi:hypothetical protein